MSQRVSSESVAPPVSTTLVCPSCREKLHIAPEEIRCGSCGGRYGYASGYPDLIVGERFPDEDDRERTSYEEKANADTARNYWLPLFDQMWPHRREGVKLLSVGCGTGADVDLLHAHGFDIMGVDCGNRTRSWPRRSQQDRLVLASGQHLPFENETFDGAYCGCVFPHVGVVGDSFRVTKSYELERLGLAKEMVRVLKPGGKIVVSSPNRWFPADLFHGRDAGCYVPRANPPWQPFLLSYRDYARLFGCAGAVNPRALPVEGYWGFIRSRHSWKGCLLSLPVRAVFWLVSRPGLAFLRRAAINPWLVVMMEKES